MLYGIGINSNYILLRIIIFGQPI